jgi:hypothetical protein
MKPKNLFSAGLFAGVVIFVCSSCSRPFGFKLFNNNEVEIQVALENKKIIVQPNTALSLSYGDVVNGFAIKSAYQVFQYQLPRFGRATISSFRDRKSSHDLLTIQLESDGAIYLVQPNTTLPSVKFPIQPDGFPIKPLEK